MAETNDPSASRQQRVGTAARAETRARLERAAAEEFIEHGYAAATVSRIAKRAGVTVQTLYLACGSKRELLRAYMVTSLSSALGPPREVAGRLAGLAPPEVVTAIASLVRVTADSAGTGWKLYRDAAATDPEIAADWDELQQLRRRLFEQLVAFLPLDALRPGLDPDAARDTAWVVASPESYDLLVTRAGFTLDEFERWMSATLAATLLR